MALPPPDPRRHRRQQRRRALIGWIGGCATVALVVAAAIAGGHRSEDQSAPTGSADFLDYHLSSAEFDSLRTGEPDNRTHRGQEDASCEQATADACGCSRHGVFAHEPRLTRVVKHRDLLQHAPTLSAAAGFLL